MCFIQDTITLVLTENDKAHNKTVRVNMRVITKMKLSISELVWWSVIGKKVIKTSQSLRAGSAQVSLKGTHSIAVLIKKTLADG